MTQLPLSHHLNEIHRLRGALEASHRRERSYRIQCMELRYFRWAASAMGDEVRQLRRFRRNVWRLVVAAALLILLVAGVCIWGILAG